jgi:hypothetical protein
MNAMNILFAGPIELKIEFTWWQVLLIFLYMLTPYLLFLGAVILLILLIRIVRHKPYNKKFFIGLLSVWTLLLLWYGWFYFKPLLNL